jgi:excinuclease ABC subunit B
LDETHRRREKQLLYNAQHGITPQQIRKSLQSSSLLTHAAPAESKAYVEPPARLTIAADPIVKMMTKDQLRKAIEQTRRLMTEASKNMEFLEAAHYRDEMLKLEALL